MTFVSSPLANCHICLLSFVLPRVFFPHRQKSRRIPADFALMLPLCIWPCSPSSLYCTWWLVVTERLRLHQPSLRSSQGLPLPVNTAAAVRSLFSFLFFHSFFLLLCVCGAAEPKLRFPLSPKNAGFLLSSIRCVTMWEMVDDYLAGAGNSAGKTVICWWVSHFITRGHLQ